MLRTWTASLPPGSERHVLRGVDGDRPVGSRVRRGSGSILCLLGLHRAQTPSTTQRVPCHRGAWSLVGGSGSHGAVPGTGQTRSVGTGTRARAGTGLSDRRSWGPCCGLTERWAGCCAPTRPEKAGERAGDLVRVLGEAGGAVGGAGPEPSAQSGRCLSSPRGQESPSLLTFPRHRPPGESPLRPPQHTWPPAVPGCEASEVAGSLAFTGQGEKRLRATPQVAVSGLGAQGPGPAWAAGSGILGSWPAQARLLVSVRTESREGWPACPPGSPSAGVLCLLRPFSRLVSLGCFTVMCRAGSSDGVTGSPF